MPINSFLYPGAKVTKVYDVDNSLRFNDDSNDYLTRTFSAGNRKTWSFSTWIKRCNLINANMNILGTDYSGSGEAYLLFRSGEQLHYGQYEGGGTANNYSFQTNQAFRDTSSWYNILFVWDTTQSTSSDRMKLFVNGTQVTSFSSSNYPSLNLDGVWNSGRVHYIGDATYGTNLDGYLCETVFVDGTALTPTDVGEFDSDSPTIWKPKDVSGLTFGTNGFYQEYKQSGTSANSSGLGADTSGNDHHFTVNNLTAVDQSTDTCTNNGCTLNPLNFGNGTLSEGNLKWTTSSQAGNLAFGTIGIDMDVSNQFYWESKIDSVGGGVVLGIAPTTLRWNDTGRAGTYGYYSNGDKYNGTSAATYGASFTTGDIIGVLAGNGTLTFYKNGASQGTAYSSLTGTWLPFLAEVGHTNSMNFGSPSYSISSGNSDPAGYGNFEHSTNGGYALNTKNLAEFG